jgi:4-diphosphocytidyl-2-C-methyl-D-erythritol kinase
MIVFPNAKINIGLNVVQKREDGFHNIESIFYPVFDVFDVLEILESETLIFTSSGIDIPGNEGSNLCLKAYQLIKQDYDIPFVKIHLHKVIPIGAGLGGGSADAAFTLKALNNLFNLDLSIEQLINYSRELGSDCAFFVENKPVYAFNKGDEFEVISLDLSLYNIKIEYPSIHIGTGLAYRGVSPKLSLHNLKGLIQESILNWKGMINNDFENSVFPKYPEIKNAKQKMYDEGAVYAAMTGSGSAIFGVFKKNLKKL